jgi:hypothetical protein
VIAIAVRANGKLYRGARLARMRCRLRRFMFSRHRLLGRR